MDGAVAEYLRSYGSDHPTLEAALGAEPGRTMELLRGLTHQDAGPFTDDLLARLERHVDADPNSFFWILHAVAEKEPDRARTLMDAWSRLWERAPKAALDAFYYVSTNNAHLARPDHVRLVCATIPEDACRAFMIFQQLLVRRPELIVRDVVQAVVRHVGLQVNQAFYFIREVLRRRPDLTPLCTAAIFEAALLERHPAVRAEMLEDLRTVATHSHVQSELEKALRTPVRGATVAARALMGLLFRQKTRNQQRVLIDAVGLAARWPALWDHLVFLLGTADPKTASAAAAAEFLEGVYRLHHLVQPHQFGEILVRRLEMGDAPAPALPADVAFLGSDADLSALWRRTATLADRFGAPLRLRPLERWRTRPQALEAERQVLARAETTRRRKRRASLEEQIAALRKGPDPRSARALAKELKDALRAEAVETTRRAIETASLDAYRAAVRRVLGRDYDLSAVDPHVLPAFLYIERLGHMRNNRRYLTRLIEDRLEGRPHDWMRTEPPVQKWAERVRAACPTIRLERWRAAFARDYAYVPKEVDRERRRR
ncbi:MAG TPA: hypothetical protein VEJ18_10980, partial [Planctomycetota bacterium]|nr:hypothetical protein [Planctomycetota bacterium]